jgi:hypothetical protein
MDDAEPEGGAGPEGDGLPSYDSDDSEECSDETCKRNKVYRGLTTEQRITMSVPVHPILDTDSTKPAEKITQRHGF